MATVHKQLKLLGACCLIFRSKFLAGLKGATAVTFCVVGGVAPAGQAGASMAVGYQDIETVEVTAVRSEVPSSTGGAMSLPDWSLSLFRPNTLAEALVFLPSVNVRTNSRGETLASVRGSGERQFALFLDGAAVNVPWDNRFDLSLMPSVAMGDTRLRAGPTAVSYGANTAGGVLEISPRAFSGIEAGADIGTGSLRQYDAALGTQSAGSRLMIAANVLERDGLAAPRASFAGPGGDLITNTDRQQTSFYLSAQKGFGKFQARASLLVADAEFGIAPEQGDNIDPADARYWRYPDTSYWMAIGGLSTDVLSGSELGVTVWYQRFNQDIASYTDVSYAELDTRQQDENNTVGGRASWRWQGDGQAASLSAFAIWSQHEETEISVGGGAAPTESFSNVTTSVGADYWRNLSSSLSLAFGIGYDQMDPRKTAGRERGSSFDGMNATAELSWNATSNWRLRTSASRRVRLPTMRELFGVAIGRFVINPDLKPETSWLFEASAEYQEGNTRFAITPFYVDTQDTLDQTRVSVDGVRLRQRVNLRGSRSYGVEVQADHKVGEVLKLIANATWNRARAKAEDGANSTRRLYLSDRPNWLAQLSARYQLGSFTTFGLNVVYRGAAKSQDPAGDFVDLPSALSLNLALRHRLHLAEAGAALDAYVRLDNVTDTFIEPQLGLPDPGRRVTLGLRAAF